MEFAKLYGYAALAALSLGAANASAAVIMSDGFESGTISAPWINAGYSVVASFNGITPHSGSNMAAPPSANGGQANFEVSVPTPISEGSVSYYLQMADASAASQIIGYLSDGANYIWLKFDRNNGKLVWNSSETSSDQVSGVERATLVGSWNKITFDVTGTGTTLLINDNAIATVATLTSATTFSPAGWIWTSSGVYSGALIDDVTLTAAVPEPATAVMFGLCGVGAMLLRRRK